MKRVIFAFASVLAACASSEEAREPAESSSASALTANATNTEGSVSVQASGLKLTFASDTVVRSGQNGPEVVVSVTANRDLESVFSWVPDDAFGRAELTDAIACRVTTASSASMTAARASYNAACARDGFCGVDDARVFDLGASCAGRSTTGVAEALAAQTSLDFQMFEPSEGVDLSPSDLASDSFFAYYGDKGLLAAVVAAGGDSYYTAKKIVVESPCHNCHTFLVRYVFVFPNTGRVITIDGRYGYDS